jgi:hypothetical protein
LYQRLKLSEAIPLFPLLFLQAIAVGFLLLGGHERH